MLPRRSLLSGAAAVVASAIVLAGCSSPAQNSSAPGSTGAPAASGDTLIIYSNSVSDGRGDWLKKEAQADGFTLEYIDLGGGDVQNRLLAEKNNPVADVTFGMNNVYFERLKADGVLEPYTPNWSGDVDASLGDGEQFWPIVREPIFLAYNKAAFANPADAPQDWFDLYKNPVHKGKYEVPTALGGAGQQIVVASFANRFRDANGQLGVSDEGWNALRDYYANGNPAIKGTDLYARMKNGDVYAGQMWLAGKVSREKQFGVQSEGGKPAHGVPFAVQHVALVKGSKKADQAKKFIDWFGGPELQAKWSNEFFTAPTNAKAGPNANQEAIKETDSFKKADIDWAFTAQNLDKWVEKITLEYLG